MTVMVDDIRMHGDKTTIDFVLTVPERKTPKVKK